MAPSEILGKVETLQNILLDCATGGVAETDKEEYKQLRNALLQDPVVKALLPQFVVTSRDLSQFWSFIKPKFARYQERREYLWSEFAPLIEKLENTAISPADPTVSAMLEKLDVEHVHQIWGHALERRNDDPDGAITAARTLLESVCKTILDDLGIEYSNSADLPKLYMMTAEQLSLAPSQHTERIFKQIFGGCQAVVDGLAAVRNSLGDAHGQGKQPRRPAPRHAELAVNLAGSMATFLIRTWEYQKGKAKQVQE